MLIVVGRHKVQEFLCAFLWNLQMARLSEMVLK